MNRNPRWSIVLAALVLVGVAALVSACGPEMATPTPKGEATTPPTAVVANSPVPTQGGSATAAAPTVVPVDVSKLPIDPTDYHALGPADAAVTITEYSDFQ